MKPTSRSTGNAKEEAAAGYLEAHGYFIIERNFRARAGEIDIVAKCGNMLVFIEVRYRKPASMVTAEESVTPLKVRRLRLAIRRYLAVRGFSQSVPVRVDLCVVRDQGQLFEVIPGIVDFN